MLINYKLDEKQTKVRALQMKEAGKAHETLRARIEKRTGFDPASVDWLESAGQSGFVSKIEEMTGEDLREANAGSSMGQLFRYGVQDMLFDGYKDVPVVYPDIVQVRPSSNRQEWYAPLYGAEIPLEVQPGGPFTDSRIQGLDTVLVNKKVGRILSIEQEAFDDDQTGQLGTRASKMGARVRYKEEFDVMAAVRAASYSATLGNKSADGFTALTQAYLEAADLALMTIRDPLGNRILVSPEYLLVGTSQKFNAAKLLHSTLQPSIPGGATETIGSAASGQTGWTNAINPLQGLYKLGVSRFLAPLDWFLMEARTALPFQERQPLEILQEAPNSGVSFSNGLFRWRVARRYQTAVLESRYFFGGYVDSTAPTI